MERKASREIHEEYLGASEIGRNSEAFPKTLLSWTLVVEANGKDPMLS
jgi:hypothetical protein